MQEAIKLSGDPELTVIDLFCGAGGLSLGLEMTGFHVVAAFDNWVKAVETYNANRTDKVAQVCDLAKDLEPVLKLGPPFILAGGPPCQEFSQASWHNRRSDRGGDLTPLFADIACELRPKWVVMENVNTIKSIGENRLRECTSRLRKGGYGITLMILNAFDFGVPQIRRRLFIIAREEGNDNEMEEYVLRQRVKCVTVRDYRPSIFDRGSKTVYYYRHPVTYSRRAIFSLDEPSPTIRGVNRPIPGTYKLHENDATRDLSLVRPLTYKERAAIQTFPREYVWKGSKTEIEQLIGNAVPPLLAKAVGKAILLFRAEHLMTG